MISRKLLWVASVMFALAGCGGGGAGDPPAEPALAPASAQAPQLTQSIGAEGTPVRLYLAFYGMAPGNPTYTDYLSMMQTSGPQAVALALAGQLSSTGNAALAGTVLTNLGITAATTNSAAYTALSGALAQIFGANPSVRGVIVLNLVNILKDLEGNDAFGAAAQTFNSQTSAAYTYATNPDNTQSPALSGVAAKGPLADATVGVYDLNADGTKGALLASGTTTADGRFSIPLASRPAGAVLLETTGGTYESAYDGATVSSQGHISAMVPGVSSTGESSLSVNPLSDMATELARSYITVQKRSFSESLDLAEKWVAWQYGLKTAPSRIVPKFDVTAAGTDPQSVHLALVLAALDTLGKRLSPSNPDAIFASLSADFSDGVFDGKTVLSQPVALNGGVLPTVAGTTEFLKSFALTYTGSTAGLQPGYVDAHFSKGTITENYQAQLIPVYVAPEIASFFPATWSSPLPKTTSLDASATGYSCGAGASVSFDANGHAICGSYYFCYGGATLITSGTALSCSDGGLVAYQAATIPVYTAPNLASYTATTIDNYLAATTIGDPPTGTPAIFRATAVHVLTQAERDAMMAADRAAGDAAAAKVSALGVPTSLQMEWLSKIGNAVIASVGH